MRAAFIHFELWFLYEDEYTNLDLLEANFNLAMQEIKEKIEKYNIDTIIGEMWADGWAYKDNEDWYNFLYKIEQSSKKLGIKNFYLGVGQCHQYQHELNNRNLNFNIIEYHWPIQDILKSYKSANGFEKIKPWNSETNKFLFIGGTPARPKRIGMLSKFYDANMLQNAEWSFFPPWTKDDKKWCREYLGHYSNYKYKKFIKDCTRELDPIYKEIAKYSRMTGKELEDKKIFYKEWWKLVGYIDNNFFNNTSLSIVNEGPGNDTRFLTEKLWLTILNKHPFILVDTAERFQYCKDIGLRMFEDYLKHKDYGYIEDPEEQMNAVIENTQYFLNNILQNKNCIYADIEHNLKIFNQFVDHNATQLTLFKKIIVDTAPDKYFEEIYLEEYNRIPKLSDIPVYKDIK